MEPARFQGDKDGTFWHPNRMEGNLPNLKGTCGTWLVVLEAAKADGPRDWG